MAIAVAGAVSTGDDVSFALKKYLASRSKESDRLLSKLTTYNGIELPN
ncbi:MAG: hypothetical protein AB1861_12185 [Cyanobacteriota bacterium]